MNQTIQQTTQKLIDLLPENKQYYRLDELRSWNLPPYIVQRIQVELERNMAESMVLPQTDWANTQSDAVLDAWQQYVQAIRAEARLPASFAKAVIETAVADTLDMLIEPRKNIPDVIFGSNDELDYEQLCDRVKAVVVYRHFATLVPRYMEKKELDTLSRDRCDQLIKRADERLTANYSPLNWAQTLDPLFKLLDGQIDPSMLRLFFEDKEREKIAEVFDRKDKLLNRAELIEILSSPDWIETNEASAETGQETEQEKYSGEESPEPKKEKPETPEEPFRTENTDAAKKEEQETSLDDKKVAGSLDEVLDNLRRAAEKEEAGEDNTFMNTKEYSDEREPPPANGFEDPATSDPGQNEGANTLNSVFSWREEPISFEDEEETKEKTEEIAEKENVESTREWEAPAEEEDSDKPIWMNFMSEEERAAMESEEELSSTPKIKMDFEEEALPETDEDVHLEKPVIDLTDKSTAAEEVEELKEELSGGRSRFVKHIFGGSERAYEEAIKEIAMLSNWRGASKYIQKEIFQRNLVDMYSESAIDFTDRLHNYFSKR